MDKEDVEAVDESVYVRLIEMVDCRDILMRELHPGCRRTTFAKTSLYARNWFGCQSGVNAVKLGARSAWSDLQVNEVPLDRTSFEN